MPGSDDNRKSPQYLLLGQVTRPHGVRGELRLRLITDYPERIGNLKEVFIAKRSNETSPKPYQVTGMRMNKEHGLLRVDGVRSREEADRLRQHYVMVQFEEAVPLEDDEFYLFQVIGMSLQTVDGETLGTISKVMETGANDVYVVQSPEYGEILFPITVETLVRHEIEAGFVEVKVPDGLLPNKD